ncbi:MAG TPA: histidinol dehydrogenase [Longimicrobiales bacterium]|nr:histidinol dehydrogenase [Longimicrobiales bacterium]
MSGQAVGDRPRLAARGPIAGLDGATLRGLVDRGRARDPAVAAVVAGILNSVRADGDAALGRLAARYDGVRLTELEVPRARRRAARDALDPEVRAALELAAERISSFHRALVPEPVVVDAGSGVRLGRRFDPLERAGAYAPGGRALYPSSVLMCALPARAAGVAEVVLCSPPGSDGRPAPVVLGAAEIAGVDRVFALGGAGAVAALAFGTESVPRADCVVGPGNAYVAEAKRQVAGIVVTDAPAGPSEILVIADRTADPDAVAAELIAQAEHDPDSAAVLVALDGALAEAVASALERRYADHPRREVLAAALAGGGALLVAESLSEALAFSATYAPEHLSLMVADAGAVLCRVRNAGTVFVGPVSSAVLGDYVSGANHTLPTGGLARSMGGLSTATFLRPWTWQEFTLEGAAALAAPAATLAGAEGLPGHAAAARMRKAGGVSAARTERRSDVRRRPAYRRLFPYDPGRRPVALDLSDNTNRFGPAPSAARAYESLDPDVATRYPAVYADALREALAAHHGVEPGNVATGCGSDDVLDSALRAFCEPGAGVAYPDPTFGMVPVFARMNALRPLAVPAGAGDPDVRELLAGDPGCVYLCRPNNPTGGSTSAGLVSELDRAAGGVVLLDEAYADFAGEDRTAWAAGSARTLSLRTFSKAWGLAGARVGYAIGPEALIAEVEKSRGPYKVSGPSERAALAALEHDDGWRRDVVARTIEARAELAAGLGVLGFAPLPSRANFVLVPVVDAAAAGAALHRRGVGVRAFPDLRGVGEAVRITVGPPGAIAAALGAIRGAAEAGEIAPPTPGRRA